MTEVGETEAAEQRIAVIGMAGRFPGAPDLDSFWRLLAEGREGLARFSEQELITVGSRPDPALVPVSGQLDGPADFDAEFFGFTPAEAEVTDPQHRVFLECAWHAMENAGYAGPHGKSRVGVFAGASQTAYLADRITPNPRAGQLWHPVQVSVGNDIYAIPLRVSYKLGLTGPSMVVQTACSSALVAVHLACQSLLLGESDLVMAGGVSVRLLEPAGYQYQEGGILSPDGHCRPFDVGARGTVPGDGVGVVVLKRLDDAQRDGDRVHALILGSAINNDGPAKLGFTAPSADGQAAVIADALAVSDVDAGTIDYIEAHGTATPIGDPIEARALADALGPKIRRPCFVGSVKSNIGHLDAAAGIAGLLKTVLALEHRFIPPTRNFVKPHPEAGLEDSGLSVNAEGIPWPIREHAPRAGVSSFGFGGTNAHLVLEAAPPCPPAADWADGWQVLPVSARTRSALPVAMHNLATHFSGNPEATVADAAFTLQVGREHMAYRRAVIVQSTPADASAGLEAEAEALRGGKSAAGETDGEPTVAFLLPGQGSQYAGMGARLYASQPAFRAALDECAALFEPALGIDLRQLMLSRDSDAEARLTMTQNTQPSVFALEIALARMLETWGIRPGAMLGHSLGELTAACLAGVLTLEDAVTAVAARARLMQQAPPGRMAAVPVAASTLQECLGDLLSREPGRCLEIAAVNSPSATVIAGEEAAVARACQRLSTHGIACRLLGTSHAFHTALLDETVPAFAEAMHGVRLSVPRIPFPSNETGGWITDRQATDPDYWARQIRRPVDFSGGVQTLLGGGANDATARKPILLEVGPGGALSGFARLHRSGGSRVVAVSMLRRETRAGEQDRSEDRSVLEAVARLWEQGTAVDWTATSAGRKQRVPLPGYPFDRRTYLLPRYLRDAVATTDTGSSPPRDEEPGRRELVASTAALAGDRDLVPVVAGIWREIFGVDEIGPDEDYYEIGGNSLYAIQIMGRLREIEPGLPMSLLFTAPTVRGLAEAIEAWRVGGQGRLPEPGPGKEDPDTADLESLLDEIEKLTPEEAEALLEEGEAG